ncbi:hypothetical protein [Ruminococcus flavefaciens]|uniref:phosphoribosyltransferase-like protein n=1 Tax=Ruminococcus flavefaciens TaxID=1265 RepID=UPI0026EF7270|nr:hypothetical protein [Ruminococcus flavefaciens]
MDVNEAINNFCTHNDIDLGNDYLVKSERKYLYNLKNNVTKWINGIPDEETKCILLNLFSEYEYVSTVKFQDRMEEMFNDIRNYLNTVEVVNQFGQINNDEILFITVESTYASGSQEIISAFRYINTSVKQQNIIAKFDKALETSGFLDSYKVVVLIDDIVGSGWTISDNAKKIAEKIISNTDSLPLFLVCSAYCKRSKNKKDKAFAKSIDKYRSSFKKDIMIVPLFKENINGILKTKKDEKEIIEKYEHLINEEFRHDLEERSNNVIDKAKHQQLQEDINCLNYEMGFKNGALGISFYYNTPNNTLSSFWLKTKTNTPPFLREEKKIELLLQDIQKAKKKTDQNNYKAKCIDCITSKNTYENEHE